MTEKGFALIKGRTYKGELKKRLSELAAEYDKVYRNDCLTVLCDQYCDGYTTQKKMGELAVQIEELKEKIYGRKNKVSTMNVIEEYIITYEKPDDYAKHICKQGYTDLDDAKMH